MIQIENKSGNNYGKIYGETKTAIPKIKVIGIGGGGNNAVRQMVEDKIKDVDFYFFNTELAMLNKTKMDNVLQIGKETTKGLGAGANPEVGEKAAIESKEDIKRIAEYFWNRKEYRNWCLFIVGIHSAFRASDLLRLKKNFFQLII